ncbi:MAG TPA: 30S ribosomal protein S4e [Methanotrichaceae archaeon]|nr:30S ribosomal protein S4e [Methanotrichaceae archaeon]
MTRHQKRITVPRSWPIERKVHTWVPKISPGPHTAEDSMPILMVLRDMLKVADNAREAKRAMYESNVLINGKVRKDPKFPVGIFDIISLPALNQNYRMMRDSRGMFYFQQVDASDAKRLVRIANKTTIKGGKQQLNLNDGTNMIVDGDYKAGDSLILSLDDGKIADRIEFKEGNLAMVIGGQHTGQIGKLKSIIVVKSSRPNRVVISGQKEFETIVDYVYMIGRDAPAINVNAGAVR